MYRAGGSGKETRCIYQSEPHVHVHTAKTRNVSRIPSQDQLCKPPHRRARVKAVKPQPKPMSPRGSNATAHSHHRHPDHARQPHERRQITVFFPCACNQHESPPPSTRTRPTRPVAAAVLKPQPKPMSCIGTNATAHSHHRHPGHERQPHHRRQITVFLARVTNMNRPLPPRGPALRGRWLRPFSSRNPSPCRA